ncbi:MAG: 50S ribosomal protein L9 [Acidimicrobiia bacterium]|nr:50S ribosomal protein L9 [Acidimicrobiia bacterium]
MKVVLRDDVDGVGRKGDLADVAAGFARNYLLPKGLALKATPGLEAQAEGMRRTRALRSAADRADAEELATRLVPMVITIGARAGDEGKLFGSVTTADVVTALEQQASVEIDRRVLQLDEPIKSLGTHQVMADLHPEVQFPITIEVVAV